MMVKPKQSSRPLTTENRSVAIEGTLNYYYDGDSVVEERNGSGMTMKQFLWGAQYIDDLVQVSLNSSPATQSMCDTPYWAMCDANWNVLGIVNSSGVLKERYEYSAYGQRSVFISAGSNDPYCYAPTSASQRMVTSGPVTQFYGLCEVGHQGLMHDEECGIIYSRDRSEDSVLERWMQEDPAEYIDGFNEYVYERSGSINATDPSGLDTAAESLGMGKYRAYAVSKSFINGVPSVGSFPFLFVDDDIKLYAFAKLTALQFQENPKTDARDGIYRLYARISFSFSCCHGKIQHVSAAIADQDGGKEPLGLSGTVNISKPTLSAASETSASYGYETWGHPSFWAEPSFDLIHPRLSVNIWHDVTIKLTCEGDTGFIGGNFSSVSAFPSHRLWLMGTTPPAADIAQGAFASLWESQPGRPTFVKSH